MNEPPPITKAQWDGLIAALDGKPVPHGVKQSLKRKRLINASGDPTPVGAQLAVMRRQHQQAFALLRELV